MKTIYFVRHGLSAANKAGIASGGDFETPLTSTGRADAKKAGSDLKAKKIDLIVCSPMERTVETAQIIAQEIGYDRDRIVKNENFRERLFGHFSGGPDSEYLKFVQSGVEVDGVETTREMVERVLRGLEDLNKMKEKNIVLVAHGGVGRALKVIIEKMNHDQLYKMDAFKHAAIYEFNI